MAKITYITHAGVAYTVNVPTGRSLMEGAVMNNVPGILAECGGGCSCATCHVFLDEAWMEVVTPAGTMEESMLDFVEEVAPNSRLSCQISIHDGLDGLVVRLPQKQG